MNRLKHTRCYLIGAMDRVPDGGEGWRRMIRHTFESLEIYWFDPTNKPIDIGIEDKESRLERRTNKMAGLYGLVKEEMIPIREVDKRMVCISDWLICNIDINVHACGTYEELFLANSQNKPILVHVEGGKINTPDWLLACLHHDHIFGSWADLHKYIRYVAHDKVVDHMGKWMFFDWMGE